MYEGNNPSAKRSQTDLSQSMLRLLKQYTFSQITITMICQEAMISRQTFYQLFSDKEDIIRYLIVQDYSDFEDGVLQKQSICMAEFTEYTVMFFYQKKDFFQTIIKQKLQYLFMEVVQLKLKEVLNLFKSNHIVLKEPLYSFFAAGLSSMILYQIEYEKKENIHANAVAFAEIMGNPEIMIQEQK